MLMRCCYHLRNFGFERLMGYKKPYKDKSITDGICKQCFQIEINKFENKLKRKRRTKK